MISQLMWYKMLPLSQVGANDSNFIVGFAVDIAWYSTTYICIYIIATATVSGCYNMLYKPTYT